MTLPINQRFEAEAEALEGALKSIASLRGARTGHIHQRRFLRRHNIWYFNSWQIQIWDSIVSEWTRTDWKKSSKFLPFLLNIRKSILAKNHHFRIPYYTVVRNYACVRDHLGVRGYVGVHDHREMCDNLKKYVTTHVVVTACCSWTLHGCVLAFVGVHAWMCICLFTHSGAWPACFNVSFKNCTSRVVWSKGLDA